MRALPRSVPRPLSDWAVRQLGLGALFAVIAVTLFAPLLAQAACTGVEVSFKGERWTEALEVKVTEELQPEIERNRLCGGTHRATVLLDWNTDDDLELAVDFTRGGIERELKRHLDPTQVPADALSLAIAAVAGDLLAEVAPHPPAAPSQPRDWSLGARAAALGGVGFFTGGGELFGRVSLGAVALQAYAGGGAGNADAAPAGSLDTHHFDFGAAGLLRMVGGQSWTLSAEIGFSFAEHWLQAHAAAGYTAHDTSLFSIAARGGLDFSIHLGPALIALSGGAEIPFPEVDVTDGSRKVGTPIAWAGYFTLGVGYTW